MFSRRPRSIASDHAEPVGPARIGEIVGGFRIIRKLGESERADVYLGHAGGHGSEGGDPVAAEVRTAAVKVFRPGVTTADIERQIEAISRASHRHIVALRDLATVDTGQPCLLLERLARGSLAALLAERTSLGAGEAVTILAPIAAAVDVLHGSAVVHGRIRASSILFRQSGAPVLASFGHATLGHTPVRASTAGARTVAALADDQGVLDDRAALAALARLVLGATPSAATLIAWIDRELSTGFQNPFGSALAERLFSLAAPEPVRFGAEGVGPTVPLRVSSFGAPEVALSVAAGPTSDPGDREPRGTGAPVSSSLPDWLVALHLPDWVDTVIRSVTDRVAAVGDARRATRVRARYWVSAAVVGAGLVAAAVLVPTEVPTELPADGAVPASTEVPIAIETGPVVGDDPVAALAALLDARNLCVGDLSVVCLDAALQPGSAAMEQDVALIRFLQGGGEVPDHAIIEAPRIVLVERLGDTALLDLGIDAKTVAPDGNPASALVSRGEAGWRIRGYLE